MNIPFWSGQPFPPPGDLLNLGIEPRSPALQADSVRPEPPGKPQLKKNEGSYFKEKMKTCY